jgi:DNA-binding MarR family transcriptional regulator
MSTLQNPTAGLDDLDPLLQHRSRLGALVLLSGVDAMTFTRLRELLTETDGNLGAQMRKLEDAGYVAVKKEFVERKPASWYSLTTKGRRALKSHLSALEHLLKMAKV